MPANPPKYNTVNPYLLVPAASEVLAFAEAVFDGRTRLRLNRPDGSLGHAEIEIGDAVVMLGTPPEGYDPFPASLFVYVDNSDARYQRALAAGGESVMEPTDMPDEGVRYGGVRDPGGNLWWIAEHVETFTPEEQQRRIDDGMLPDS